MLAEVIHQSCGIKAEVVAEDEREQGRRAILNYGHTFAHALETLTGYEQLLHGEAVAIGMVLAADCACRHGLLDETSVQRIRDLVGALGLPTEMPDAIDPSAALTAMGYGQEGGRWSAAPRAPGTHRRSPRDGSS